MASSPQTELYLIRHGIAAERGSYDNDADRPLTDKGRERTAAIAQRLHQLGCHFDHMLTSPLVRAQQTTEILLQAGLAAEADITDTLAPDGTLEDWLVWLAEWQSAHPQSQLALVGHEPNLSRWGQYLVHGQPSDRWQLKKAGIIGLHLPEAAIALGRSELFWLTPPKLLL